LIAMSSVAFKQYYKATHDTSKNMNQCVLFFSMSDGTNRAQVYTFTASNYEQAWKKSVQSLQKIVQRDKYNVKHLRIDWVVDSHNLTWKDVKQRLEKTKRNFFRLGLSLDSQFERAFLEQELSANSMLYPAIDKDESRANLNEKNFNDYVQKKYPNHNELVFSDTMEIILFSAAAVYVDFNEPPMLIAAPEIDKNWTHSSHLNTGHRVLDAVTPDLLYRTFDSATNFLAKQVQPDGRFIYGLYPCFDRPVPSYNTLRHASSLYSMLEGYEVTRNTHAIEQITSGIHYLANNLIRQYTVNGKELCFLIDTGDEIKLGGNAVSILALVKYSQLTGDQQYLPLMEKLALGFQYMQNPETGQFNHVLHASDLSLKDLYRTVYYDGEATFALMRLYGLTKDERWINLVEKAFEYFIEANLSKAKDHWLSYCVNELTLYRPEEKYFYFGIQNVIHNLDFILNRETTYPTLLELMMAAESMLQRIKQMPSMHHLLALVDEEKFYKALHHRAYYLLNGYFWPEIAMFYKKPDKIVGSFFIRHHRFRVRIDDVQHYISGLVAYRRYLIAQNDASISSASQSSQVLTILDIKKPKLLYAYQNGQLPETILTEIRGGRLLWFVAKQWNKMRAAALEDGVILLPQIDNGYRTIQTQTKVFLARYESVDEACDTIFWNKKWWRLKKDLPLASVPGTSNHGWGLSIDVQLDNQHVTLAWLKKHAVDFGFCWEYHSEPWHITYFKGDTVETNWRYQSLETALDGRWIREPIGSVDLTGIAVWLKDFRIDNAVMLSAREGEKGISISALKKLPTLPKVIVTSLSSSEIQEFDIDPNIPIFQTVDYDNALYQLTRYARLQFRGKVIGVTGSAGKTTTTHLLSHMWSKLGYSSEQSRGNANLAYGIAWNMCQMQWNMDYYAVELAIGNMDINTRLARPDIAVVTNIAPVHLGKNATLEMVARKKAEIFRGVADDGFAVINRDTEYAQLLISIARTHHLKVVTYGRHSDSHIKLTHWSSNDAKALVETPSGLEEIKMPFSGIHMVLNALACIAVAQCLSIKKSLAEIFIGFEPVQGRGDINQVFHADKTFTIIDESYNANPLSMVAAIQAANNIFAAGHYGRYVMVLGDMLELGKEEVRYHEELVEHIKESNPDLLLLCGPLMKNLVNKLKIEKSAIKVEYFDNVDMLIPWLSTEIHDNDLLLIKSSNGTGLYKLVEFIKKRD